MMKAVTAKEFDMVASWSVDRLGRSLTDLLSILQGLHEKGVGLFLHQHKARYDDMRDCMRKRRARGKSPRRGLAVNSWVGEKGRPPREMETAPREWSRLSLTAESRPSVRAPPLTGDLRRRECGIYVAVGCRP
jgi:hypothetical protein